MNVALCVIATGKYGRFVLPLWESAKRHFLRGHNVKMFLFSDQPISEDGIVNFKAEHEPWPGPTLHRYRTMMTAKRELYEQDYAFYIDADMRFVGDVGDEVLGNLVAVVHPGYDRAPRYRMPYDHNPRSRACVMPSEGTAYYAGGFQGGSAKDPYGYVCAAWLMHRRIWHDDLHGVIAAWHDESHWNRHCIDLQPTVILPSTYCWPEHYPKRDDAKIIALDKNHSEMRS